MRVDHTVEYSAGCIVSVITGSEEFAAEAGLEPAHPLFVEVLFDTYCNCHKPSNSPLLGSRVPPSEWPEFVIMAKASQTNEDLTFTFMLWENLLASHLCLDSTHLPAKSIQHRFIISYRSPYSLRSS